MDDAVLRSLARWPNVPAVYGWLELDRRGNFLVRSASTTRKFERIGNSALREFIARNYAPDARGCWYFQNGPQRVYVGLAYTPLVVHYEGERLLDQCGHEFGPPEGFLLDDEGSVLARRGANIALVDDRDLERFAERASELEHIRRAEVPGRFRFVPDPASAQV